MIVARQPFYQGIKVWATQTPDAPALISLTSSLLTYSQLFHCIDTFITKLHVLGFGSNDRIAIVIPDGIEMAVTFLAVSSIATATPLNPTYRSSEFEFYLTDLNARALVLLANSPSPAREVADKLNIPVLEVYADNETQGTFVLRSGDTNSPTTVQSATHITLASAEDVALVLHTSGTTSRPKIVPLTHSNLCTSARNIGNTLHLSNTDRCLNVMPLFHIHGLMAALLSSLVTGGCMVCTSGFQSPLFLEWLAATSPTWYTAVPTMHQAILERTSRLMPGTIQHTLRFIRSSSAALPPQTLAGLEKNFAVPVIEAYGMTEATHQMASNPLPPAIRKPGSVGVAAGPEISIMDETGTLLPAQTPGEIVIRGQNVTSGYDQNPSANQQAFTNGWFRTGDLGFLDEEEYVFVTGRIKEIINRGGEKISPREIEEVVLNYPSVSQAAAFAIPDPRLGEEIALVVTMLENTILNEKELRQFAARYLADFKIPKKILVVQDIPKGPTGKVQRINMAHQLGLDNVTSTPELVAPAYIAPGTPLETELVTIYEDILKLEHVGVHDDFIMLGGDSVLATQITARIHDRLAINLPIVRFFELATVSQIAQEIVQIQKHEQDQEQAKISQLLSEIEGLSDEEVLQLMQSTSD